MSILDTITKGRVQRARRTMIYGPSGIGKTTMAAGWRDCIFVQTEDGSDDLDVARFPQAKTLDEARAQIAEIASGDHEFRSIVLDTINGYEALAHAEIAEKAKKDTIGEIEFGKGAERALVKIRALLILLDRCIERGIEVVILAHSRTTVESPPDGEDFLKASPALHKKAAPEVMAWCDEVLFADHEVGTRQAGGRSVPVATGQRVLYTQPRPTAFAKTRLGLPAELPLDFGAYAKARLAAVNPSTKEDTNDG